MQNIFQPGTLERSLREGTAEPLEFCLAKGQGETETVCFYIPKKRFVNCEVGGKFNLRQMVFGVSALSHIDFLRNFDASSQSRLSTILWFGQCQGPDPAASWLASDKEQQCI